MKVLLTGATGLLGGKLLERLISEGHKTRCLVREESPNLSRLDPEQTDIFYGDARVEDSFVHALNGMDALLHVAGIEYTPQVVPAMRRAGVGRLVIISSTSAHSAYEHRSGPRLSMEALVRDSGLDWAIVRPSMIYGSELDKNMHKLLRFLDRSPVFPVFGSGANLWQPVYYKDLAAGVFAALTGKETLKQTYDLPGARPLTYLDLVRTAARALDKKPRTFHLPLEPARMALAGAERIGLPLPVKSEQVLRLQEDKAYPYEKARRDLGYAPRNFEEGIKQEVTRLREIGILRTR